ncbi:MAG: thioredoxin family protein [Acidimicrobiia bacterium]|nr:thioredoxin family protein [Acidimicrobiia bacterium]
MHIELLHVADCPNLVVARERIDLALDRAGLAATVREVQIDTPEAAERAGMSGSPTVLVDGVDPFGGAGASLACRLYRSGDVVEGAPPVDALLDAFAR